MEKQKVCHGVHVICDGSPSRIRRVRRISFGMTILPRSSIRRTIPVAFISFSSTLCVLNITLLLSANNGDLCVFCRWKKIEEQRKKTTIRKKRPASDSGCRPILKVRDHFELFPRERVEERLALRVEAEDAAVGFSSRFPIQQPVSLEKLP